MQAKSYPEMELFGPSLVFVTYLLHEIRALSHSGMTLPLGFLFFCCTLFLFSVGVGPDLGLLSKMAPHLIWVTFFLANLLSYDHMVRPDATDGTLEVLSSSPFSLQTVLLVKGLAHWLAVPLPLALCVPFLGLFLNLPLFPDGFILAYCLAVGGLCLSFWGLLCACLLLPLERSGMLCALLLTPFVLPVIILGVACAQGGQSLSIFLLSLALCVLAIIIVPLAGAIALRFALTAPPVEGSYSEDDYGIRGLS